MRVLLAFDKFKDSLASPEACGIAARALRELHSDWTFDECPLADGGEGFASILTNASGGTMTTAPVAGPRGESVEAGYGIVPVQNLPAAVRDILGPDIAKGEAIAVIEMAAASGLALLPPDLRNPWETTTQGTGELIKAAAARGVAGILLGVGGSATHDLGLGALGVLGLEFHDQQGGRIPRPSPAIWPSIARLRGALQSRLPPLRIACDTTSPLLGPRGAAAVYGAQKGLRAGDRKRLEAESARLALMLCGHFRQPDETMDLPGAGAAGGLSFGLVVAAGASLIPGFELVSAWLDLDARIAAADLVITGEGRFDESSLTGKGPGAVAQRAIDLGKPVHLLAGQVAAASPAGLTLHSITAPGIPIGEALKTAPANLSATLARIF